MEALLFLGDRPVERIAADAVPQVARVLRLAGHRVRWQPDVGCLFVDSPLEGRIIGCRAHGDARGVAAQSLDELFRWVRLAGGVPAAPGLAADAVIRLVAEPCGAGDLPSILVAGGRRSWFLRRRSDLVAAVANCLRDLVDVPVGVISRPTDGAEVEVRIKVPPENRVSQAVARAIWLALMATCGRSRGLREPSTAWLVQALEWWESPPPPESGEAPSVARPTMPQRTGRPSLRPPGDPVVGRRPRVVWESEGRDPFPRTPALPEPGAPAAAPAGDPVGAGASLEAPPQPAGMGAAAEPPSAPPVAAGAAADASPKPPTAASAAAEVPSAAAGATSDAPPGSSTATSAAADAPPGPSTPTSATADNSPQPSAASADTAAEPVPSESTRTRVAASSHIFRFPVGERRSSATRR